MSNIRTLQDLERTENKRPLPADWVRGPSRPPQPVGDEESGYTYSTQPQIGYIDMNGEVKHAPVEGGGRTFLLMCCPCCVNPCGSERRSEYFKSLKSFCVPVSLVQIVMMIVALAMGGVIPLSENPAIGPGTDTFIKLGAKSAALIKQGQIWRFITPIFLHAGILHLLVNLIAQLRFGLYLERKWGTVLFVLTYLSSGVGGSLMSCLLNPGSISVGASGALMGMMGGYLAETILTWQKTDPNQRKMALTQSLIWVGITLLFGFSTYVDNAAHFGGLITGFIVGCGLFAGQLDSEKWKKIVFFGAWALMVIWLFGGMVLFWLL